MLGTVCLFDKLSIRTISFVWFARRAGVLRATLRVMTGTANGALGRTSDTVSGVGTALVALVIAAGRVVSTVAYHLCARTITRVPCRAYGARCTRLISATGRK